MKKFIILSFFSTIAVLIGATFVYSAPTTIYQPNTYPITDSTYESGTSTKAWLKMTTDELCLTGDSCKTSWPTGGSGSFNGFLTSPLYITNGTTTSTLTSNSIYVATSTANPLGLFNVDSSGNVSASGTLFIGTAGQASQILGSELRLKDNYDSSEYTFFQQQTGLAHFGNAGNGGVWFGNAEAESMLVDDQRVLVADAATAPSELFDVDNTFTIDTNGNATASGTIKTLTSLNSPSITLNGVTRTTWPAAENDWGRFGTAWGLNSLMTSSTFPVHIDNTLFANGIMTGTSTIGSLVVTNTLKTFGTITSKGNILTSATSYASSSVVDGLSTLTKLTVGSVTSSGIIYPNANNTIDIGSFDYSFKNAYASGTVYADEFCFPNGLGCLTSPISEGSAITLYPWNMTTNITNYESMRTIPTTTAEIDESCSVASGANSGYCASPEIYISTTTQSTQGSLSLSQIPAGTWDFKAYTYVGNTGGNTKLEFTVFKRDTAGTETFLFQATSTDINLTAVGLVETQTAQPAFTITPTDRLLVKVQYWTDSGTARVLHWVYQGTSHNSHIDTPMTVASRAIAYLGVDNTFLGTNTFAQIRPTSILMAYNAGTFNLGKLYADSNGNLSASGTVYVGTKLGVLNTAPTYALDVVGGIRVTNGYMVNFGGTQGSVADTFLYSAGANDLMTPGAFSGLTVAGTNGSTTSTIGANYLSIAYTTTDKLGKLYVNSSGNLTTSGTIAVATQSGFNLGKFYVDTSGNVNASGTITASTAVVSPSITLNGTTRTTWPTETINDWGRFGTNWGVKALMTSSTYPVHIDNTLFANGIMTGTSTIGTLTVTNTLKVAPGLGKALGNLFIDSSGNITTSGTLYIAPQNGFPQGKFSVDTSGNVSASGTLNLTTKLIPPDFYFTITYNTTTAWAGTTTIPFGVAHLNETVSVVRCFTNVGTLNVNINDGTNLSTMLNASTTAGIFNFSTNNAFTVGEKRYLDAGTPASSPTSISCTFKKNY